MAKIYVIDKQSEKKRGIFFTEPENLKITGGVDRAATGFLSSNNGQFKPTLIPAPALWLMLVTMVQQLAGASNYDQTSGLLAVHPESPAYL